MNRHINTFEGGMKSDLDNQVASKNTYLYSLNGKVVYNKDQGTYAWENSTGNRLAFVLNVDYGATPLVKYMPIGSCELNGKLIIISTNNTYTEIGVVFEDQFGTFVYKTMFNDKYDPYGKRLRCKTRHQIILEGVVESESIERIYWNDDKEEPRCFNISYAKDFDWYSALVDHSPTYTDKSYSVHGISQMPDLTWGLLKYVRTLQNQGQLTVGRRQYTYRYIHKTGYASPWAQPSNFITLTDDNVDGTNWTKYQMGVSGAATNKAIELELKYLDERFQEVEVACILWETDTAVKEVSIFNRSSIPTGGTLLVQHVNNKGTFITIDEITQRYLSIEHAKTQTSSENFYLMANLKLRKNLEIDTSSITIAPKVRKMLTDNAGYPSTTPLTNRADITANITKRLFSGHDEVYRIEGEYPNYKGTQWQNLFTGEWRDEIRPYAIVLFDRKGQPCFAQHIADFKTPKQYTNQVTTIRESGIVTSTSGAVGDYFLTNWASGSTSVVVDNPGGSPILQGDDFVVNVLGATLSGIDLTDVLYDENGELQISGFSIVKADRVKSIIAQGILMNTQRDSASGNKEVRPLPTMYNWLPCSISSGFTSLSLPEIGVGQDGNTFRTKDGSFTFETPDYLFDQTIFGNSISGDEVEIVGVCMLSGKFGDYVQMLSGSHGHLYNKYYYTQFLPNNTSVENILNGGATTPYSTTPMYGTSEKVKKLFGSARIIDNYDEDFKWREYAGIQDYQHITGAGDDLSAKAHKNTVLLVLDKNGNIKSTSLRVADSNGTDGEHNNSIYYLVNYKKGIGSISVNKSTLENRVYNNIGHFIPINQQTITEATQLSGRVVFNDVEVWGGDCYVDMFSYCRLEPWFTDPGYGHKGDCGHFGGSGQPSYPDYAIGMVFPVESNINFMMRKGDEYAKVGTKPFATHCGRDSVFPDGIYWIDENTNKTEPFLYNKSLFSKDLINVYNPKSAKFREEYDYPTMEVYSEQKFYGEFYDSFRKIKVNSFQYAEGKFGEITQIERLFNQIYMLQRNAFGRIRFRDRQVVDSQQGNFAVGSGTGFDGHEYISTMYGTQHQWAVCNNSRAIWFLDAEKGKLIRFSQAGLDLISDKAGQHQYFTDKLKKYWKIKDLSSSKILAISDEYGNYDNPCYAGGIHAIWDVKNNSILFTFTDIKEAAAGNVITTVTGLKETIEFNETDDTFKTFYSFTPNIYMKYKMNFFSNDSDHSKENEIYVHDEDFRCKFYGVIFDSKLRFIANPNIPYSKVFDNIRVNVNADGATILKSVLATTPNQTGQTIVLNGTTGDDRPKYREDFLVSPLRGLTAAERLRGKYIIMEYLVDNGRFPSDNKVIRITDIETQYRISQRT